MSTPVTTENVATMAPEKKGRTGRVFQTVFLFVSVTVTIFGVTRLGWSLQTVVLLYWMENLIIGFWQIVKMLSAKSSGGVPWPMSLVGKLLVALFFCFHYGGFCGGHGLFIIALTSTGGPEGQENAVLGEIMKHASEVFGFGPWIFLTLLWGVLRHAWQLLPQAAMMCVVAMFLSRGVETWRTFFASGEWRHRKGRDLMGEPYKHIVVVHIAIILCGFFVMALGNAMPLLLGIVFGKTALDLREIWGKRKSGPKKPTGEISAAG